MSDKGYNVIKKDGKVIITLEFDEKNLIVLQKTLFEVHYENMKGSSHIDLRDAVHDKVFKKILEETILDVILEIYMEERKVRWKNIF